MRVFNVNTRSRIDVTVLTPGRRVVYAGATGIDGVAGTAAPIRLNFLDAWGAVTGSMFPTGRRIDRIDGLDVTCIDAAMPLVIFRATDLGLSGRESPAELDADRALLARLEAMRCAAGAAMGLGDVSGSVVPKPVIVSPGDGHYSITSRYFTPRRCHASHAVTGAIGVATAYALPGTVASAAEDRRRTHDDRAAPARPHRRRGRHRWPRRTAAIRVPRWYAPPERSCRATCSARLRVQHNPPKETPQKNLLAPRPSPPPWAPFRRLRRRPLPDQDHHHRVPTRRRRRQ